MAAQELPRGLDVFFTIQAQNHDGQIAADSVRPKPGLRQSIQRQNMRARSQRWVGIKDAAGESLKKMRLVGVEMKMVHLDLCARPGQTRFALEDARVAIFFRQRYGLLARRSDAGSKDNLRGLVRLKANPAAQTKYRIKHRAYGVRERPVLGHCQRIGGRVSTTQKARTVCLKLDSSDRIAQRRQYMHAENGF